MASSKPFEGEPQRPIEALIKMPQMVAGAMDPQLVAEAYRLLKDKVGQEVIYASILSGEHVGRLISITPRVAVVEWADGMITRAPFMARLRLKQ